MLTINDCIEFSGLPEDVIDVLAHHEHVPCILAAELGACLTCNQSGLKRIFAILREELDEAVEARNLKGVRRIQAAIGHFLDMHPEFRNAA